MAKKTSSDTFSLVPLKLQGQSVFLAGNFYFNIDYLNGLIEIEGGKTVNALTDKTDIVVLGYSAIANPKKKALKLNSQGASIKMLTLDQFDQVIKPTPDEAIRLLRSGSNSIARWNRHCVFYKGSARLQTAYIRGADFSNTELSNANLSYLTEQCDFTGANLSAGQLNLLNCQLDRARLDGVRKLSLVHCSAENAEFRRVAALDVSIKSSNLTGSRFASDKQVHLNFVDCRLVGVDLTGLNAPRSIFHQCVMTKAKLTGVNLEEADFAESDLSMADFTNANLKLAKFPGATVDGADFTGATMTGADVSQADFSNAKGFDLAQVQPKGCPGPAVREFLKIAAQAERVSTSLAVTHGTQAVVLTIDHCPNWNHCRDSAGNRYHHGFPIHLWSILATKWHGAVPDLASITVRASKAPLANKALKQLAIDAWCEIFAVEPPSDKGLKKAVAAAKSQKKEKADQWLALLRKGKQGVEQWNHSASALHRLLNKLAGIDLANADLCGVKLENLEWKNVNLSGANLSNAEISCCSFPKVNFAGACLTGAKLQGSSFNDANLEKTNLTSADLSGTSFLRAKCTSANFAKAQLKSSDLCGADLTGADLKEALLTQASYDEHTRWPKGFSPTMEMIWEGPGISPAALQLVQSTRPKGKLDIEQFMTRLEELTDAAKLAKALSMLKADRFRLYAQVNDDHFVGVVKSQSDPDLVYSCRLNADGTYACCTQNLNVCGGLRGSLCKHLLVIIVGLTKNAELDPNVIDTWIRLSKTNKPALDKDAMSETFLRYNGAEAGEVDWRPTETIPEDYYAM